MHPQNHSPITRMEAARNATLDGFHEYAYQAKMPLDTRRPLMIAINLLKADQSEANWERLRNAIDAMPLERKPEMLSIAGFLKTQPDASVVRYRAHLEEVFNPKTYRTFSFLGIIKRDRKHSKFFQIFTPIMDRLHEASLSTAAEAASSTSESALPAPTAVILTFPTDTKPTQPGAAEVAVAAPHNSVAVPSLPRAPLSSIPERLKARPPHAVVKPIIRGWAQANIRAKAQKSPPPHSRTRSKRDAHLERKKQKMNKSEVLPSPPASPEVDTHPSSQVSALRSLPNLPFSPSGSILSTEGSTLTDATPTRTESEGPKLAISGLLAVSPKGATPDFPITTAV